MKAQLRNGEVCAIIFLVFVVIAGTSFAGDGQVDILPNGSETFTISQPGSYILTGDVAMTEDVTCISIMSHEVTVDLNGHIIRGTDSGSTAYGVNADNRNRICIKNGRIRSFGASGILTGHSALIKNVDVYGNEVNGLDVGGYSQISGVNAVSNKECGVIADTGSIIENCIASENARNGSFYGINAEDCCIIKNCIANFNGNSSASTYVKVAGVYAGNGSSVINCCASKNRNYTTFDGGEVYGILTLSDCTVKDNTCFNNTSNTQGTRVAGIKVGNGSILKNNNVCKNISSGDSGRVIGIDVDQYCTISDNACRNNKAEGTGGQSFGIDCSGSGNIIRNNNCSENDSDNLTGGIILSGDKNKITGNICIDNKSGLSGYGIVCSTSHTGHSIIGNHVAGSETAGINLGNGNHYCADNTLQEISSIINTTNSTLGSGDHANINIP